jgi:hypothetical protein
MSRKYELPYFLADLVTHETYERWLRRKAQQHVRRDRQRGNKTAIGELYRNAIHDAVKESGGLDAYTGEKLEWTLISKCNNDESKEKGRRYKHEFSMLPTVDHVSDGTGLADFKICGWRTNDAKNDLDLHEFVSVCRAVVEHQGFIVRKRG